MVEKLKNVQGVTITGIEKLVVFSYINKIAIFNLETRKIVAEFKVRYNDYWRHIEFGKYIAIDAEIPCLIDLEKMEIIKKFNGQSITKKYLIDPKYKSKEYDVECCGISIIDIIADKIPCNVLYTVSNFAITSNGITSMFEPHSVLCAFDSSTFEFINCKKATEYHNVFIHSCDYKRNEPKYSFLEYDEIVINNAISNIQIKREPNFKVLFYNKNYNVLFSQNGDYCYSYYVDNQESVDKTDITENDFLAKLGSDEQKYIRENGLTDEVLKYLDPEVALDGGYFWALDSIERKAKQFNMSFDEILSSDKVTDEELILYTIGWFETEIGDDGIDQYFTSTDEREFTCLIKSLKLIGATETVKVVEEGIKLKQEGAPNDKYYDLEEKLDEDYVGLAIEYIKKLKR